LRKRERGREIERIERGSERDRPGKII